MHSSHLSSPRATRKNVLSKKTSHPLENASNPSNASFPHSQNPLHPPQMTLLSATYRKPSYAQNVQSSPVTRLTLATGSSQTHGKNSIDIWARSIFAPKMPERVLLASWPKAGVNSSLHPSPCLARIIAITNNPLFTPLRLPPAPLLCSFPHLSPVHITDNPPPRPLIHLLRRLFLHLKIRPHHVFDLDQAASTINLPTSPRRASRPPNDTAAIVESMTTIPIYTPLHCAFEGAPLISTFIPHIARPTVISLHHFFPCNPPPMHTVHPM